MTPNPRAAPPRNRIPRSLLALAMLACVALVATQGVAEQHDEGMAYVVFEDQHSDGETVTVARADLPEGGFVVLYDEQVTDGEFIESIVGVSDYLEPGNHTQIVIGLDRILEETEILLAWAHMDTTETQTFESFQEDFFYSGDTALSEAEVRIGQEAPAPGVVVLLIATGGLLLVARRRAR